MCSLSKAWERIRDAERAEATANYETVNAWGEGSLICRVDDAAGAERARGRGRRIEG